MNDVVRNFAMPLGVLLAVFAFASSLTWVERRLLALFQDRLGPNRVGRFGLLQLVADAIKILAKENWIPPFSDRPVFVIAPGLIMVSTLLVFSIVPFSPLIQVADPDIGVLFFLGLSSLAVYSVALAGWSSNSKYGLLGSIRAVGQMLSYEIFMGLSLMGVVAISGTFSLRAIVEAQSRLWFCVPQFAGFAVFLVAGLAETRRIPFDLPEAENELVAGYHTEYSGMKFAMFYLGDYVGLTLIASLTVVLFLGGWKGPWLAPVAWFLIKTSLLIGFFILVRASLPRPRYDQLMSFGWKLMFPLALANIVVTAAVVLGGKA